MGVASIDSKYRQETLKQMRDLVRDWDLCEQDIRAYFSHPYTDIFLTEDETNALVHRIHTIREKILGQKKLTPKSLLYSFAPGYIDLLDAVRNFCRPL